jgi:ferric-dicitrate binding protein FerR (iron transport regulator)
MADHPEQDSVAALLRSVGKRSAPPAEDYERIFGASRLAWQRAVRQRSRRRWTYALAAGIALVGLAIGVLRQLDHSGPAILAGTLTIVTGPVFSGDATDEDWKWLVAADVPLLSGTRLRTDSSGRAALRLVSGAALRIAGASELILGSGARIELLDGRVYLDTQGVNRGVEIVTRFGTLRDIGTQFEVFATGTSLRVRTREGAVTLTRAQSDTVLECGVSEELLIDMSGQVKRGRIAAFDPEWAWVETLAEAPRGPELTLRRFLEWVARETGRRLRYDSPETEMRVNQVVLHGTTPNRAPVQALEIALATTDFDYSLLEDGTILLRRRNASSPAVH